MQKECHFVQQALRRARALDDDRARVFAQLGFFIAGQVAPGVDDHRRERADVLGGHALEQLVAEHVRQLEVDDHAVVDVGAQQVQGRLGEADVGDLDVIVADQAGNAVALQVVVFHQQHTLDLLGQLGFQAREHVLELFTGGGLHRVTDGAHVHGGFDAVFHGNHMHRDMAGVGVFLEALQHGQPGMVGQAHVQQDRIGDVFLGEAVALVRAMGHQAVVAQLMSEVEEDTREVRLVFHHQDAACGERGFVAVVGETRDPFGIGHRQRRNRDGLGCRGRHHLARLLDGRRVFRAFYVLLRQHQGEGAALARLAGHADIAAEQGGQVAGDRQAEAGAAIAAVGGAVGLAEGFEDALLLVRGNPDARVTHGKGNALARRAGYRQAHVALLGELDRVGQQILEDLLQALAVGKQHRRRIRLHLYLEAQLAVGGQRFEHAAQAIDQARHAGVFRAHFKLAGFDLGNIQDVIDQVEQVIAGRIDRLGKLDLFSAEVVLRVFRQQLGQDQRAVQRRAQFVGHVGEEFGFVLAGALQLFGAVFQLHLSLVQLDVLAVHGVALVGEGLGLFGQLLVGLLKLGLLGFQVGLGLLENARLLLQLFVGGLEFFLLHLQLFVELLGLGEHFLQTLAIPRGFDGRTDIAGNQLQQLYIAIIQRAQEAQLNHAVDAVVITGRHHQHTAGIALTQAGTDLEIIHRHVVQANQAIELRGLADDAFVVVDRLLELFLLAGKAISGHALEAAVFFAHIHRCDRRAHVLSKELQDIAPQHVQGQLAQHLFGQFGLAVAQPSLLFQAPRNLLL